LNLSLGVFRKFPRRPWKHFRGFLMGVDLDTFQYIGGFDESFVSWGLEDSDFAVRAIRSGCILKDGRYSNAVIHLYHPESLKLERSANSHSFEKLLNEGNRGRRKPLRSIFRDW
jgi:GT2 family glycosyltransferase